MKYIRTDFVYVIFCQKDVLFTVIKGWVQLSINVLVLAAPTKRCYCYIYHFPIHVIDASLPLSITGSLIFIGVNRIQVSASPFTP